MLDHIGACTSPCLRLQRAVGVEGAHMISVTDRTGPTAAADHSFNADSSASYAHAYLQADREETSSDNARPMCVQSAATERHYPPRDDDPYAPTDTEWVVARVQGRQWPVETVHFACTVM
jgi:hypothetical protein